jgi:hypothetical protein
VGALSGEVEVRGGSGTIPLVITDDLGTGQLKRLNLDLQLRPDGEYGIDLGGVATSVVIGENDNWWRGTLEVDGERFDLTLFIRSQAGSDPLVFLDGEASDIGPGGFVSSPAGAPLTVLTDTGFRAEFGNIRVLGSEDNLLGQGGTMSLRLEAGDEVDGEVVGGYRVTLLPGLPATSGIPGSGSHHIYLAEVGGDLYIRVFDTGGGQSVNFAESSVDPGKSAELAALRATLGPLWNTSPLDYADKRTIRRQVTALTGTDVRATDLLLGTATLTYTPGPHAHLATASTGTFALKRDLPLQPDTETELETE